VEYPETEVEEYVTYSFARQAARQLQYNKWHDGIGFDECTKDEVGIGFKSDIQDKKTKEDLLLSDGHLTLSTAIIDRVDTKKWKNIAAGWETSTQFFADDVQQSSDKKSWFSSFTEMCELQYNSNYRGQGVVNFYKLQRSEKRGYAVHIRRHIEEKLFNEWHSGVKSILEIEKFVSLLIADCDERIPKFNEKISTFKSHLDQEIIPEIKRCNIEWDNIGWIRDAITNASSKIFSAYKNAKCEYYTMQTRIEGFMFAVELIQAVKEELVQLLRNVTDFQALLTSVLKLVEEQADAKCKPQSAETVSEAKIVKKYDPEQVRATTRRFTADEGEQKKNASEIRSELVRLLGEESKHNFRSLIENVDLTGLEDIFTQICLKNATRMMNDLAKADSTQKMLDVNILEKIKQEYNTDERLESFIRDLVRSAQCYLQFNPNEISKVLPSGNTNMMRMVQLSLPEYNDATNFRQKFINLFKQICPGFNEEQDLSVNYKANRIVVVAAASGFPLRFVANVANLKERYEEMLIGPKAALNKMVLHTETHAKPLPELFEKSIGQKEEELVPTVILAFAMGLVIDKTNPTTGETFKAVGFPDDFGDLGDWLNLGKDVFQAVKKLAAVDKDMEKVTKLVESTLSANYIHNEKKAELKKSIGELIKTQVLQLCGGNDLDPRYVKYKQQAVVIFNTKLAEK
jgi:hypothetical protein